MRDKQILVVRDKKMNNLIRSIILNMLINGFFPVTAAVQQINRVVFTTTFPFTVGNTKFPAGSYSIKPRQQAKKNSSPTRESVATAKGTP
jgi:hypothetical protein